MKSALGHQLGRALRKLGRNPDPRDVSVHDARKDLKRARASLRLLRDSIGESTYSDANQRIRDAARLLSPVRDAKVLIDLVARLRARSEGEALRAQLGMLERNLDKEHQRARRQLSRRPIVEEVRSTIRSVQSDSRSWPAPTEKSLNRAVKRIYRKSRKAFARAETNRREEVLHESRKQTKYLRNALEGLAPGADGRIAKRAKRAKAIEDSLGDEHDLAVLRKRLLSRSRARNTRQGLLAEIEDRRKELQKKSMDRSRRFHRSKAKAFVDSLEVTAS